MSHLKVVYSLACLPSRSRVCLFLCPAELVGGHTLVTFHALVFPHLRVCRLSFSLVSCVCQLAPESVRMIEGNVPLPHKVRHRGGEADCFDFEKHHWPAFRLGLWGMLNVECYHKSFCVTWQRQGSDSIAGGVRAGSWCTAGPWLTDTRAPPASPKYCEMRQCSSA